MATATDRQTDDYIPVPLSVFALGVKRMPEFPHETGRLLHDTDPSDNEDLSAPLLMFASREQAQQWAKDADLVETWGDKLEIIEITLSSRISVTGQ